MTDTDDYLLTEKEKLILIAFWNWLDEQKPRKGKRFGTAVKYDEMLQTVELFRINNNKCVKKKIERNTMKFE